MPRKKLKRFADICSKSNILEPNKDTFHRLPQFWTEILDHKNPINLEVGCGKGEYSISLAQKYPKQNFIGIDLKRDRIWSANYQVEQKNLKNVFFLQIAIQEISNFFCPKSISNIWIPFPDPQPRKGQIKKRLTHPNFLESYHQILKTQGTLNFKTDNSNLFAWSLFQINQENTFFTQLEYTWDLYSSQLIQIPDIAIQTYFEQKFLKQNKKIKFCRFQSK